jgi:acyl carrier protein
MNESTFEELREFIVNQVGVNQEDVTYDTRLYEDLGVYGDDAVELLINYGKRFNVDVSRFMAADYFKGEGIDIIGGLIRPFIGKASPTHLKVLTVRNLEEGISAGKLDEEIMNRTNDA